MDGFIKALVDKLPEWSFHVFAGLLSLGLVFYFYKNFFLTKKFNDLVSDVLKRDDRLKHYQEEVDILRKELNEKAIAASQVTSTLGSMTQFIDALNNLRTSEWRVIFNEAGVLLQRMLDVLALDIKSLSGEKHRCGIWLVSDNQYLILNYASAGFPSSYIRHRKLHINRSTAGRCIRKQVVIQCADVTKDEDWEKNEDSKSPYKSLICIPFGNWGVLTIDGQSPMNEECKQIGELYASVITGVLNEHFKAFIELRKSEEDFFDTPNYGNKEEEAG